MWINGTESIRSARWSRVVVLIQRPGEVVSKDELMQAVWGDAFADEANLSQSIFVLRKALWERASDICSRCEQPSVLRVLDALVSSLTRGHLDLSVTRVSAPQLADLLNAEMKPALGHVCVVIQIPVCFHDSTWRMGLIP